MISLKLSTAVFSLLADTVSDDSTRVNLHTALISPDGTRLVATDGVTLVQIDSSHEFPTANLGNRIDPAAAVKLLKAGKYPERVHVDLNFPNYEPLIPALAPSTTDSEGRYDASVPPSVGFNLAIFARLFGGLSKVSRAAGNKFCAARMQHPSTDSDPCRVDLTVRDGDVTLTIVAIAAPCRI